VVPSFQSLGQYGVAGIIAAGLLTLFVLIFRRLVENIIEQNKHLQEKNQEYQQQLVTALHSLTTTVTGLSTNMREMSRDMGLLYNRREDGGFSESTGPIRLGDPRRRSGR
jgi:hypothetical protein